MAMLSAELISADHICRQEKVSNLDPNAILHRCPFDFKYVVTADARYLDLVVSRECYAKCHNGAIMVLLSRRTMRITLVISIASRSRGWQVEEEEDGQEFIDLWPSGNRRGLRA